MEEIFRVNLRPGQASTAVQRRAKIHTRRWSGGGVLHETSGCKLDLIIFRRTYVGGEVLQVVLEED